MTKAQTGQKFIVVPFTRGKKNHLRMGEIRQASSAVAAERMAGLMSKRYAGVSAYSVNVVEESGDMIDPRLIFSNGDILDIMGEA